MKVRVAVDAMGGDNAPVEIVKGAVDAVLARKDIEVILVGIEDRVKKELSNYTYPQEQIRVVHASEIIATEEPPGSNELGKTWGGRCVCVSRKFRGYFSRGTASCWED